MHTSAPPWRLLASMAVLGLLAAGCATKGAARPAVLGRYEIRNETHVAARLQASEAGDLLAARLGRTAMVVDSTRAKLRIVLDDATAAPAARVKLLITHPEGEIWWISVVRGTPGEDQKLRVIRAHVEQALKALGARWTYDLSDRDLLD